MRQEGEPSVEEILDSIKKVIARDNRAIAAAQGTPRRREVPAEQMSGTLRNEDKIPGGDLPEPVDADEAEEILDLGLAAEIEDNDEQEDDSGEELEEALTNAGAAEAMRQSLSALAMLAEPGQRPQIVRQGETSLEGLVRELLRPMLAQWLDTHLPEIVERQVKAEIARIAGKKR